MDNASLRSFQGGKGTYMADALKRCPLFPTDTKELGGLRRQEVFLSVKRYLGMVRFLVLVTLFILFLGFQLTVCLFQLAGHPGHL